MILSNKKNKVSLAGYVSAANIKNGQFGPYGTVTMAVDDSYRDPEKGNIKQTQFIRVEIGGKRLPLIVVGDYLEIEGKLVFETWEGANGNSSALKCKARLVDHIPKAALAVLRNAGMFGAADTHQQNQQGQQGQQRQQRQQRQQVGYGPDEWSQHQQGGYGHDEWSQHQQNNASVHPQAPDQRPQRASRRPSQAQNSQGYN